MGLQWGLQMSVKVCVNVTLFTHSWDSAPTQFIELLTKYAKEEVHLYKHHPV